mgnify:CR=1 FL=1
MNYQEEYRKKLVTPEQAAAVVKSGDWVDYSCNVCFPTLLDAALAKRKDELWDAIIKSNKTYEDILQYVVEGIDVDKDVNE